MEVVESGTKNVEVAVLTKNQEIRFLEDQEVEPILKAIEEEKEAAKAKQSQEKQ